MEGAHGRIRWSTVEFSGTMVREVHGNTNEIVVPREQIRQIRLAYDTGARYPFAQFFVGFVLLAVGGIGAVVLFLTSLTGSLPIVIDSGEVRFQLVPIAMWLMIALGLWSLIGVFRASYLLVLETDCGVRKMVLGTATDLKEIRQFIRRASWSFGYEIDTSVLDHTPTSSSPTSS